MRPVSNQPGRFFATAKTHKFNSVEDVTLADLKLRPIIDQTGTHVYKASKVISKYLEPLTKNEYVINNTLVFPDIIKSVPLREDEEDVSYDVESLFTSIPVKETIEFILDEIYVRKAIKPFCEKRLHFKRLLERLTGECIFSVNGRLMKQIDGCQMGGPLSGRFADIFMIKLERSVVVPRNPPLYRRYVDDSFNRRKKGVPDELFEALNSYHPNIKYTIEEKPKHFLDTNFSHQNNETITSVHVKPGKIPVSWSSKVPKRYKRNAINGELHRAQKIASNFDEETKRIKKKFLDAGFPSKFIDAVIRDFNSVPNVEEEKIIPDWLFDEKRVLTVNLPFCAKNEEISKTFIRKLEQYTGEKFTFKIIWNTRNIRSLFPLKDRVQHRSCVIYEGTCSCGEQYIGETNRITDIRWKEHSFPSKDGSDPSKHINKYKTHRGNNQKMSWGPPDSADGSVSKS